MFEVPPLVLPVAAAAGAAAAVFALLERWYVAVPPNRALVLFGHRSGRVPSGRPDGPNASAHEPRILIGGGAFVAPWNKAVAQLSLAPVDVEATVRALHVVEGGRAEGWEVRLQLQAKVPAEPRALRCAAESLLGMGEEELRTYVRRAVEGAVPAVLARIPARESEPEWERLATEIQASVAPDLVPSGLVLRSVAVTELRRIVSPGGPERGPPGRGRSTSAPALPAPVADRGDPDQRLERVERGLRALAADLARLLRDEPPRPDGPRWLDVPQAGGSDSPIHGSMAEGRSPGGGRRAYPAEPDTGGLS